MGSFKSTILTKKAHALMAKLTVGTAEMSFTKLKSSSHDYSSLTSSQLEGLTGIEDIKQEVSVSEVKIVNDASVKVCGVFLNTELSQGYYMKTVALYADDPDEGEILYSITVANESDWMPPYNSINSASATFDLLTIISNADNVSIDVDPGAVVNISQFNEFKENVNAQMSDMANKLNSQYINVKYPPAPLVGAKGDGLTDDSTVIQNIINSVTGDGTTIYFPKGDYLFNNVSVLKSGIRIVGVGNGTVFINNHATNYCLTFGDGANDYNHMGIEGIRFGQQTGITPTAGGALRFYKTNKSFIRDIKVLNFPSAVFRGVYIYQCVGISIDNMEIEKCLEDGFRCKNHTDLTISNSRSDSNTLIGFTMDSVSGVYATNLTSYGNKQGFSLVRTDSKYNQFHFYTNCISDTSQDYNWNIKYLKDSLFTNCWGSGQRTDVYQTYGAGFYVDSATDCVNIEFHACCTQYNNAHGFDIRSGDRIKIIGGYAKKNGQKASGHGVRIGTITNANVEGFTAFDDQTTKTQQAGINITGTADYVIVKNCNLRGNVLSNGLKDDSGAINKIISDNFTA